MPRAFQMASLAQRFPAPSPTLIVIAVQDYLPALLKLREISSGHTHSKLSVLVKVGLHENQMPPPFSTFPLIYLPSSVCSERTDKSGRFHTAWTEAHKDIGDAGDRTRGETSHA